MILWILPVMFFAISPMLNDATTLLRSGIISLIPLLYVLLRPIKIKKYFMLLVVFILINLSLIISWYVNKQESYSFLVGSYGRNLGLLALNGLFLFSFIFANKIINNEFGLIRSIYITIIVAQAYGIIQYFNLDPLDWADKSFKIPLTLGNPNFSSAFLGITSLVPLYYFMHYKKKIRFLNLLVYLISGFLILNTQSSQGFIIYILNLLLFIIINNIKVLKKYLKTVLLFTVIFLSSILTIILIQALTFKTMFDALSNAMNLQDRLNHWSLAWRMYSDKPWSGFGFGDQQKYSAEYLNLEDAKKWGNYLQPDKAHSVPFDYFVGAGLVAGLTYIFFITLIFYYVYKISRFTITVGDSDFVKLIGLTWGCYVFQTLFSPSHIYLDLIGFVLAGSIIGIYFKYKETKITK
jgi:O-antigen ligase